MSSYKHKWNNVRFALHFGLLIGVILQLISSQLMHSHIPQANTFFVLHMVSGISTFICAIVYLVYRIWLNKVPDWQVLFPWSSRLGWQSIGQDIKILAGFRLPVRDAGGLAGMVQGLGLLLILAMGLLGTSWAILWGFSLGLPAVADLIISTHSALATLVWIYIIGHGVMAILHRIVPDSLCHVVN